MSIIYEREEDGSPVLAMAREIIEKFHPELNKAMGGLRLCILMASHKEEKKDDAVLKLHGYPAAAIVKVIPYIQRVDKRADAEIRIDKDHWEDLPEPQQRALLDHEITHLVIATDENGFVETDDAGRPKLDMKLHDFQFGGFRSIAKRYGADAPEVQLARAFDQDYGDDLLLRENMFAGK